MLASVVPLAAVTLRAEPYLAETEAFELPRLHESRGQDPGNHNSCLRCHKFPEGTSHPVGVSAASRAPEDLPLDNGLVTCLTCHDDRALDEHGRGGSVSDPMLRRDPVAEGLCISCHEPRSRSFSPHASGIGFAHGKSQVRSASGAHNGLDPESQSCMSCHDGIAASDAGNHKPVRLGLDAPTDHPIGVELATRNRGTPDEVRFIPPNRLDPRIRLFDRKVGCGSCHSVYEPRENHLVVTNEGSRLCLSCHDM